MFDKIKKGLFKMWNRISYNRYYKDDYSFFDLYYIYKPLYQRFLENEDYIESTADWIDAFSNYDVSYSSYMLDYVDHIDSLVDDMADYILSHY